MSEKTIKIGEVEVFLDTVEHEGHQMVSIKASKNGVCGETVLMTKPQADTLGDILKIMGKS